MPLARLSAYVRTMTLLLTGFEPFGTHSENPSREIVHIVAESWREPRQLVPHVLPVEYDAAGVAIVDLMKKHEPRAVLMLGLAESAPRPRLERVALNIDDAEIADNAGVMRKGSPIRKGDPLALRTRLKLREIQSELGRDGLTVDVSNHAGAYICNHTYFEALRHAGMDGPHCLFMHVPPTPEPPGDADPHMRAMVRITEQLLRMFLTP